MRTRFVFVTLFATLLAALLSSCGVIPGTGPGKKEAIVVDGNSQFTPEGIKAIKSSRKVVFDFTKLPMDMSALGFPEDSDGTLIASETDKLFTVTMTTPNGVVEMQTDTIRIRPGTDHIVDHIDIFINYPDAQDANQEIQRAANELGFVMLKNAEPIGPDFKDGSGKEQWYPGLGNKTGTVFSVEIHSNHDTGRMTFIYSVELDGKYYTPEGETSIASTGKL